MIKSKAKKKIINMYGDGTNCSIYEISSRMVGVRPEDVLKIIGEYRRELRFKQLHPKCENCRWKPCVGSPVCYREVIDHE